jgi:outer membrane immunogenic protein
MKKLLVTSIALAALVGPATAADQRAPILKAPPPPPIFSWSGCYVGAEGGWAWGKTQTTDLSGIGFQPQFDARGGLAGGEAGCQYQSSQIVFGIEGDVSWADKKGTAFDGQPLGNPAIPIEVREQWLATLRGRFGWAVDKALFYVTGGLAVAQVQWQGTLLAPPFPTTIVTTDRPVMVGLVYGGGIEYAFWNNLSGKVEFLFADLATATICSPTCPTPFGPFATRHLSLNNSIVRVGLNYHFDWGGPVMTKY